ncbi:unnamed protein product [Adineta ricciae]|uniref:Uncharacterized protein n=1 Tax=Adineta ricciae TaxID=249248 RepID=A0A815N9E5_ADIRI|nr:unnamed protein product [Adineta ricciae]CAF1522591.1 unnamed protein product [Adineta ricciae]
MSGNSEQKHLTPLEELNEEFKRQYKQTWMNFWDSTIENNSVIVEKFSTITLFHKGDEYPGEKSIPPVYHDLKGIAHIPLTIYLLIKNSSYLTDDSLDKYWKGLNTLEIPNSLQPAEKESAIRIITASKVLLGEEMNQKGSLNLQKVKDFCRSLTGDLDVLLDAAAIVHVKNLHTIIQSWIKDHNFDPRDPSVKVLLIGPRSNRRNNLQTTYFQGLLDDPQGRRIVYTEELFADVPKAKSIFSRWFVDEEISDYFYNDQDRMHRELLMNERVQKQINDLVKP